jgi:peptidoglycan/xylan/chitin deacetylase (PgdA/CDA1 family)
MDPIVLFHVDMDSPRLLARYWGVEEGQWDESAFFELAWERLFNLFEEMQVPATFFMVGQDIESYATVREGLIQANATKHEIANHSYTHPFGLSTLSDDAMRNEIVKSTALIQGLIKKKPVGFRSPGYDINNAVLMELEKQGYSYDSSVFWSTLMPLAKFYHRIMSKKVMHGGYGETSSRISRSPYHPSLNDWKSSNQDNAMQLLEIPLPSSPFLRLPFYFNFHLSLPEVLRHQALRGIKQPCIVYLIHLMEMFDMRDAIPRGVEIHPHVKKDRVYKLNALKKCIQILTEKHIPMRTDLYVQEYLSGK